MQSEEQERQRMAWHRALSIRTAILIATYPTAISVGPDAQLGTGATQPGPLDEGLIDQPTHGVAV